MSLRQRFSRASESATAKTPKVLSAMARANTLGMREVVAGAKHEMRDDVLAAGLGQKLANTVRSKNFPLNRDSMSPGGILYATPGKPGGRSAASILGQYNRGTAITPALGDALALPTDNVPKAGRGGRRRMTPAEVEAFFNRKLQRARLKSGNIGLFLRRKVGGKVVSQLMFTVVKDVQGRKRLDFLGIVRRWGGRFGELAAANFKGTI